MFDPIIVFIGLPTILFVVLLINEFWCYRKPKKNIRNLLDKVKREDERK